VGFFFRPNGITHQMDYGIVLNILLYALGNQKIHLTHFSVMLTLLWWSGTGPAISLRYAYIFVRLNVLLISKKSSY